MRCGLLIADSGPLIALTRLQLLHLLCVTFGEVWIPESVFAEVTRDQTRPDALALTAAATGGAIKVVNVSESGLEVVLPFGLDPGETDAIALACQERAMLLIDERKGRLAAQQLGLDIIGTIGILISLRQKDAISCLRPYLEQLGAIGYFLSDSLVVETLRRFDEL